MTMIATDREILTPAQLADELCVTTGHLAQLRFTGQGPRFMKLSPCAVRYRKTDVEEWLNDRTKVRTE